MMHLFKIVFAAVLLLSSQFAVAELKEEQLIATLKKGGYSLLIRHARAPGTFDPPNFDLKDCATQRNLSDEGREQAKQLGNYLRAQGIAISTVRSSQWCRCKDTAALAFGPTAVVEFDALNSPRGGDEKQRQDNIKRVTQTIQQYKTNGANQVMVTHMFNIQDVLGVSVAEGEIVVVRAGRTTPEVIGRFKPI